MFHSTCVCDHSSATINCPATPKRWASPVAIKDHSKPGQAPCRGIAGQEWLIVLNGPALPGSPGHCWAVGDSWSSSLPSHAQPNLDGPGASMYFVTCHNYMLYHCVVMFFWWSVFHDDYQGNQRRWLDLRLGTGVQKMSWRLGVGWQVDWQIDMIEHWYFSQYWIVLTLKLALEVWQGVQYSNDTDHVRSKFSTGSAWWWATRHGT